MVESESFVTLTIMSKNIMSSGIQCTISITNINILQQNGTFSMHVAYSNQFPEHPTSLPYSIFTLIHLPLILAA